MSQHAINLDWTDVQRVVPNFQPIQHLDVFDVQTASAETLLTLSSLAGIINRQTPRIYLLTQADDAFWLTHALDSLPRTFAPASGDLALPALLEAYRTDIKGLIIYDPALIDTVNVATTIAGQRDGIIVSPDQALSLEAAYQLPVLVDLRVYQWSTRLQAYRWAQQNLLEGASRQIVAGLDPRTTTGLRSFLVATRAFVYWLDTRKYLPAWGEGWLSERALMRQILSTYPAGAAHLGWFVDEGSGVNLTSMAAMPVLASDYFTNLEVWSAAQVTHLPPTTLENISVPEIEKKIYLSFTISDGDNLQYAQHRMQHLWNQEERGSLPIGWTLSPLLLQAAPAMANYYRRSATPNDELIAGPSGAAYIFPSRWPRERLTSFLQTTGKLMQALDMTTLEVLDTSFCQRSGLPILSKISLTGMTFRNRECQKEFVQQLKPYGLQGVLSGAGVIWPGWKKVDKVPLYHNLGLASGVRSALFLIKAASLSPLSRPLFLNLYMLAWTINLADLREIVRQLGSGYEVMLPRTLLSLSRTV